MFSVAVRNFFSQKVKYILYMIMDNGAVKWYRSKMDQHRLFREGADDYIKLNDNDRVETIIKE